MRLRGPLGTRVIASQPAKATWNLLAIQRSSCPDYLLGMDMEVLVIQEIKDDFLIYLEDQSLDPIEVTMDKTVKKELLSALSDIGEGGESYWKMAEDENIWGHEDDFLTLGKDRGTLTAATTTEKKPRQPLLPRVPKAAEMYYPELPQPERLPYEVEMNGCIRDLVKLLKWDGQPIWLNHFGHVMMFTKKLNEVLIPPVGPGARHLRWTAVRSDGSMWNWIEQGAHGKVSNEVRKYDEVIVIYRWTSPNYASEIFVSGNEITAQEKRMVQRCHVNLGHPTPKEFVRLLKAAGTRDDIVQYALREFECPGCSLEKRPATRLPAATPRTYDFNVVVGIDVLFVHGIDNKTEHPVLNITCWGTLYSTFGMIDHQRRTAELTWKAFTRLWLRTFGAPQFIIYDQGNEFVGRAFQEGLESHGICPVEINRDAPFENGVTERRGGLFKDLYYRPRELVAPQTISEVETLIFEVSWSLQTLTNRSGFSPAQRVLGKQPQLNVETLSDLGEYELSTTMDRAWKRAEHIRQSARQALLDLDTKERLGRRELERHQFTEGEPVMIWRQGRRGALAKTGPCFVVIQRG